MHNKQWLGYFAKRWCIWLMLSLAVLVGFAPTPKAQASGVAAPAAHPQFQATTRNAFAKIEGESANENKGLLWNTDPYASGDSVLGSFDNGDWAKYYNLDFGTTGTLLQAQFMLAVPAELANQQIEIRLDSQTGTLLGILRPQSTGNLTNYTLQSIAVASVTGVHSVYLVGVGQSGIGNIDYFQFVKVTRNAYARIEGESANENRGLQWITNPNASGGQALDGFDNGDWAKYKGVDFGAPNGIGGQTSTLSAKFMIGVPAQYAGQQIEIRLDSPTGTRLGVLRPQNTGNWSTYTMQTVALAATSGIHDVYLLGIGSKSIGDIDYFQFVTNSAYVQIEGENVSENSGLQFNTASNASGARALGGWDNGDWAKFSGVDFGAVKPSALMAQFAIAVLDEYDSQKIEIRLDSLTGTRIGTLTPYGTGGNWTNYVMQSIPISPTIGVHNVYLVGIGKQGIGDIDYFKFVFQRNAYIPMEAESADEYQGLKMLSDPNASGGKALGDFNNKEWIRFRNVDFGNTPTELDVQIRMALGNVRTIGGIDIRLDSLTGRRIAGIQPWFTAGWSDYQIENTHNIVSAVTRKIAPTGVHDVYLVALTSEPIGNIDYVKFVKRSAYGRIEAESMDRISNLTIYSDTSASGGSGVGTFENGSGARYDNIDFGDGNNPLNLVMRLAVDPCCANQSIEIRLDSPSGTLLGTLRPKSTGNARRYKTQSISVPATTGVHTVYLLGVGLTNIANVDYFQFANRNAYEHLDAASADEYIGPWFFPEPTAQSGFVMGEFHDTGWLRYTNVNFGTSTAKTLWLRLAVDPAVANQTIEIHMDKRAGPLLGTLQLQSTGNWSSYTFQGVSITPITGTHDIYLVGVGSIYIARLDYITFAK